MKYISTRGGAEAVDFVTAARSGLAPDGGLYVPEVYPKLAAVSPQETYIETASRIMSAFAGGTIPSSVIASLVAEAYAPFGHDAVTPLRQASAGRWMLELYHGPSLAFKDIAMRMIARIFDYVLSERGERMTILCATSGDTGGAAASAFAGAKSIELVILHPKGRVSEVQRRFMTATGAKNVHNLALEGDFDGTQKILKALLADAALRERTGLAAVNSINWLRIAAQSVYFARVQAALGSDRPLQFVTPTGNFGDAFSGYVAAQTGLVSNFACMAAVNENDALVDLFGGRAACAKVSKATLSPAMDIQVPSNFERLLFDASGRSGDVVLERMNGGLAERPEIAENIRKLGFTVERVSDPDTRREIEQTYRECGIIVCPHTAVGLAAARRLPRSDRAVVVLSTAHPAKFPEVSQNVLGLDPPNPAALSVLAGRDERMEVGPMSLEFVRDKIEAVAAAAG